MSRVLRRRRSASTAGQSHTRPDRRCAGEFGEDGGWEVRQLMDRLTRVVVEVLTDVDRSLA